MNQKKCEFSFDGRIDTGELAPGESWTGTLDDVGSYKIIDPNHPWMNMVIHAFPDTDSEVIRKVDTNQAGN